MEAVIAWGPAAFWAAVLFFLSELSPGPASLPLPVNDKLAHLALYAVLGGTLAWGQRASGRGRPLLLLSLGVVYGALDEWHQRFVPGRQPSLFDLLADSAGVLLGFCLVRLYFQARNPDAGSPRN